MRPCLRFSNKQKCPTAPRRVGAERIQREYIQSPDMPEVVCNSFSGIGVRKILYKHFLTNICTVDPLQNYQQRSKQGCCSRPTFTFRSRSNTGQRQAAQNATHGNDQVLLPTGQVCCSSSVKGEIRNQQSRLLQPSDSCPPMMNLWLAPFHRTSRRHHHPF